MLALLGSSTGSQAVATRVVYPCGQYDVFLAGCSPGAVRRLLRRSAPHPAAVHGERRRRPLPLAGVQCLQRLETAAPAQAPPGAHTAPSIRRRMGCAPSAADAPPGCTATPGTRSWGRSQKRLRRRKHRNRRKRQWAGKALEPSRRLGCTLAAKIHINPQQQRGQPASHKAAALRRPGTDRRNRLRGE